jgi:hypothetical protein
MDPFPVTSEGSFVLLCDYRPYKRQLFFESLFFLFLWLVPFLVYFRVIPNLDDGVIPFLTGFLFALAFVIYGGLAVAFFLGVAHEKRQVIITKDGLVGVDGKGKRFLMAKKEDLLQVSLTYGGSFGACFAYAQLEIDWKGGDVRIVPYLALRKEDIESAQKGIDALLGRAK